jgi:hypothetical protein
MTVSLAAEELFEEQALCRLQARPALFVARGAFWCTMV